MTVYNSEAIDEIYARTLKDAKARLSRIEVFCGQEASFTGINGWVFEQTIQFCLRKELEAWGIKPEFKEQRKLKGRAKVDLVIRHLAIEIKSHGTFGGKSDRPEKYLRYKQDALQLKLSYLFLTRFESHLPFRRGMIAALGAEGAFFLDEPNDWCRFVLRVKEELSTQLSR